jgi:hypothetical protein
VRPLWSCRKQWLENLKRTQRSLFLEWFELCFRVISAINSGGNQFCFLDQFGKYTPKKVLRRASVYFIATQKSVKTVV